MSRQLQRADTPPWEYHYSVFFLAKDVPLPPSPHPLMMCWVSLTRFPSVDDEVACLMSQPVSVMACVVPPTCWYCLLDLRDIVFPSLDKIIELKHSNLPCSCWGCTQIWKGFLLWMMTLIQSIPTFEVPMPPRPPPAKTVLHIEDADERKYPDLQNIRFPSLLLWCPPLSA